MPSAVDESDSRLICLLTGSGYKFKLTVSARFWDWGGTHPDKAWFDGEFDQADGWNPKRDRMLMVLWEGADRRTKHHISDLLKDNVGLKVEKLNPGEDEDDDID